MQAKSAKGAVGTWVLVTALVVAVTGASRASGAFPGANGKIAFDRGGKLYLVNRDGMGLRRLTMGGVRDYDPAWSPRGRSIAFVHQSPDFPEKDDLFVVHVDGSGLGPLVTTFSSYNGSPTWSPNGRRVAFEEEAGCSGNCWQIYIAPVLDTQSNDRPLGRDHSATNLTDLTPAWSPNSDWIAFSRGVYGSDVFQIYLIHPNGSGLHRLTRPRGLTRHVWSPDWSPSGKRIAFTNGKSIFVIDADGRNSRRLTDGADPAWSPDGSSIVFVRSESQRRDARQDVWVMSATGTAQRRIIRDGDDPDWQPVPD
jgi:Tol biopolymer transport system component